MRFNKPGILRILRRPETGDRVFVVFLCLILLFPFDWVSLSARAQQPSAPERRTETPRGYDRKPLPRHGTEVTEGTDSIGVPPLPADSAAYLKAEIAVGEPTDSTVVVADDYPYGLDGKKIFNPDPQRAVWMSALFPGLGQIYNRRYWKLPIVIGGFMGLGYATNWNNNQYRDYMQGFRDLTDSDPSTKSYMDFFPPTVDESSLDKSWLERTFRSRKDFYRRNRDLCIICLVALYLVCMLDAYVDASLAHFDISPSLSVDMSPAMIVEPSTRRPSLGMSWAFNF